MILTSVTILMNPQHGPVAVYSLGAEQVIAPLPEACPAYLDSLDRRLNWL